MAILKFMLNKFVKDVNCVVTYEAIGSLQPFTMLFLVRLCLRIYIVIFYLHVLQKYCETILEFKN